MSYSEFFEKATGHPPYPYQERLVCQGWPEVLRVPTGAGKTAAVILSWLYAKEVHQAGATRLVFCLPMRVLVRQTIDNARLWIGKLGLDSRYKVHELMGGHLEEDWERTPADPAILVGTQDMLLSRALNRGYAMSRYRWSVPFGLLHNDAQWVFDEVQIMGVARATSVQLQAFREREGSYGSSRSLWMSATLNANWLGTVDRTPPEEVHDLRSEDLSYPALAKRMSASKTLTKSSVEHTKEGKKDYSRQVAELASTHHAASSLTLVILNQVERAIDIYKHLQKLMKSRPEAPSLLLLHSRFRPPERRAKEEELARLQAEVPGTGAIIVSTQVVEAGVDLSARLLITELCPFSSLVQRLGRCNRDGKESEGGQAYWIDLKESSLPYESQQLENCRNAALRLSDVSPATLREFEGFDDEAESDVVIRHKDLRELFETTSDLAGEDVDVSRYIREPNYRDVQVFWRNCEGKPDGQQGLPTRDELCSVSLAEFRLFLGGERLGYRWNYGEEVWEAVDRSRLRPGQSYLLRTTSGGYDPDLGFGKHHKLAVIPTDAPPPAPKYDSDRLGGYELTLQEHTMNVYQEMQQLVAAMCVPDLPQRLLLDSCLWHDYGKAHDVFQGTMYGLGPRDPKPLPLLGKSRKRGHHYRRGFRHEFASALAALQLGADPLIVFLVAVHHGKVRFSVRPLPQEQLHIDSGGELVIRGVKSGDRLPAIQFGTLTVAEETVLNLEILELGHSRGWVRTLSDLLKKPDYGVFRLAFLESLIRCADVRASKAEGQESEAATV